MSEHLPASIMALNAAIGAAESSLVARQQRLRVDACDLRTALRARAARWTLVAGAAAAAAGVLVLLSSRGGSSRRLGPWRTAVAAPLSRARLALARIPWARTLPLLLPLLPARLRGRTPQGAAAMLLGVALPIFLGSRSPSGHQTPPATAASFDLNRFLGRWFEIARTPLAAEGACAGEVNATYRWQGDSVSVVKRCRQADGSLSETEGVAVAGDATDPARLRVCFAPAWLSWLPLVWADYWVLHVDAGYRSALVGTPDRKHLWLLSRTPALDTETLQRLLDEARLRGYDIERLSATRQTRP